MKTSIILVMVVLVALVAFLSYRVFSVASAASFQSDELAQERRTKRLLGQVSTVLLRNSEEAVVENKLRENFDSEIILREKNTIFVDQIGFEFRDGRLYQIRFFDDETQP